MAFKCIYYRTLMIFIQLLIFLSLFSCSLQKRETNAFVRESWPWLAYIPSLNCTGAIVHSRWMLTSSNCFSNKSIPMELFIEVRNLNSSDKGNGVEEIYVIDYTRDDPKNGLTMLYLAQTVPSLTGKVVGLPAKNSNMDETAIVVGWDSRRANEANNVNIFAFSVEAVPCMGDGTRYVCVFLGKHLVTSSSIQEYCSGTTIGSPLVTINKNGLVTLAGVLHVRVGCEQHSNLIGTFLRISYQTTWIRQQFQIQGMKYALYAVYILASLR